MPKIVTANNQEIPMIGLGSYPLQGKKMEDMFCESLKAGYRLIDTSDDYRGETGIGYALLDINNKTGLTREDVFIQTKISQDNAYGDEPLEGVWFNKYSKYQKRHTVDEIVREKVHISLREMKTDYIDSLLIHYPFPGFYEQVWETMMNLKKEGLVRYIGVSNFHSHHIEKLKQMGETPSINEIYVSPIGIKQEDINYAKDNDIQIMTYSPLMDLVAGRIDKKVLQPIMDKYEKSAAHIILRWNVERNCIPLPRTKNPKRLYDNINIFDFSLSKEEVETISALNRDYQVLVESKQCPGL